MIISPPWWKSLGKNILHYSRLNYVRRFLILGVKKKFFFEVWVKKKENQKISERKKNYKKPQMKKRHFLDCAIAEVDDCF